MFSCIISLFLVTIGSIVVVGSHNTKHHHVKAHSNGPLQIIGGTAAKAGQFPHQISMRYRNAHRCGGSIVAPNCILTAFHCVDKLQASDIHIVTGEVLLDQPGTKYEVAEIVNHEQRDMSKYLNDITVLRLKTNIVFNEKVKQISFDCPADVVGKKAVASGWGLIQYPNNQFTNELMCLDNLTILSNEDCKKKVQTASFVNDGSICTFYQSGKGLCMGDSGGPLVVDGVQCGVVSWGYACARGYPDVFMSTSYYNDWIKEKINKAKLSV